MNTKQAIEICEEWFAHLQRQRDKSVAIQKLATLARTEPGEARRRLAQIDRAPVVYDGDRLEPAVRHLVKLCTSGLHIPGSLP